MNGSYIDFLKIQCQKVLPLVYDDSLSYYEVLCEVTDKVNEVISSQNELKKQWEIFENAFKADLEETVKEILNQWKEDGTLAEIITNISQSVVNAVICGIDNTGSRDVGQDITNLLERFTGRKIYFPAGAYKINTSVVMRTDDKYKGNILLCDSDAKFITDGITTMFILGNGNTASTLEKFGFDGGFIDCKNVTECGIKINNNQYSLVLNNLLMRNCGNIKGVLLGDGQGTSSQAFITNLTITGDGTTRGDGLVINSTDNYLLNVNVGRMKRNIVFGGGGNLCSNIHTWNYGTEYEALGISTPEEKLHYPSIVVNGSNNFTSLQVDNGTPAIELTQNAVQNTFACVTFNYEEDFPWAKSTDKCCCVNVTGQQKTLGNSFTFDGVVFSPKSANQIKLIKFFLYDRNTQFPFGHSWKLSYNATKEEKMRTKECDFARTIYKATKCVTSNLNVEDETKCFLVGYIGMNISTMKSIYKFYDDVKGDVIVSMTNKNGVVTIESTKNEAFSDNTSLFFGNKTVVINDFTVIPVYYKANNKGVRLNGLFVEPIRSVDIFNSFIPLKDPVWIDIPENVTKVECYN